MDSFFKKNKNDLLKDYFDQSYVDKQYKKLKWLKSFYRFKLFGAEELDSKPRIYVVNHNAGAPADILMFFIAWYESFLFQAIEG